MPASPETDHPEIKEPNIYVAALQKCSIVIECYNKLLGSVCDIIHTVEGNMHEAMSCITVDKTFQMVELWKFHPCEANQRPGF